MTVTTVITIDGITPDDVLVTRSAHPALHLGRIIARPAPAESERGDDAIDEELMTWAAIGRRITEQSEAHLAARASVRRAS